MEYIVDDSPVLSDLQVLFSWNISKRVNIMASDSYLPASVRAIAADSACGCLGEALNSGWTGFCTLVWCKDYVRANNRVNSGIERPQPRKLEKDRVFLKSAYCKQVVSGCVIIWYFSKVNFAAQRALYTKGRFLSRDFVREYVSLWYECDDNSDLEAHNIVNSKKDI